MKKKNVGFMALMTIVVFFSLALSGCTQEKGKKIIVGTEATFQPFEYTDSSGNIVGFDIDMIKWILERENYTVEIRDMAFDLLVPSLQEGKIDVIVAGMTINDERLLQVDFSEPYFEADQSVLIKKDSGIVIADIFDLKQLTKVGGQTGTTGWAWIGENIGNESRISYSLYTEAVADLKIGPERVQALVLDKPVAQSFAQDPELVVAYTIITNETYGIAVKKGNTELLNKINNGLVALKASPEWNRLISMYFE
ncbi:MAG: basic amino acid ABC transporter substrate-binding protein [Candidatus Thermoplasmatota archaeon]